MVEAFPWGSAPRYLLHDRDSIYGDPFRQRLREMGIRDVLTAPPQDVDLVAQGKILHLQGGAALETGTQSGQK